jgi:hypothetical protein
MFIFSPKNKSTTIRLIYKDVYLEESLCITTALSHNYKTEYCWALGRTSVIPALGRLKQEDCEFKATLGYNWRPCFQIPKKGLEVWLK